jgi:hypothetical protein
MPRPLPVDRLAYLRLRWTARIGTAVAAVPAGYLLLRLVAIARAGGDTRVGGLVFFMLALYLIGAGWVCHRLWRRSFLARPHVGHVDDGPATASGVPELDAAPRAHVGLGGEVEPPTRW